VSDAYEWELTKYSPDQPRVPAGEPAGGQWTSQEDASSDISKVHGGVTVFHGTKEEFLESIKLGGLKRGKEWFGRPPSVYYTTDESGAKDYAKFLPLADKAHGTVRFAIVEARIPDELHAQAKDDTHGKRDFNIKNSWQLPRDIPARYLVRVRIYSYKVSDLYGMSKDEFMETIRLNETIELGDSAAHSVSIFVPILLKETRP